MINFDIRHCIFQLCSIHCKMNNCTLPRFDEFFRIKTSFNLKITTPEDLVLGKALLQSLAAEG